MYENTYKNTSTGPPYKYYLFLVMNNKVKLILIDKNINCRKYLLNENVNACSIELNLYWAKECDFAIMIQKL